jgi:glycosyltransferase involved in cell wall biosynthesis
MKILLVTHYYEPDSGAAANRITRLARQLCRRGHDVTVLTTMPHYPSGIVPPAYREKWVVIEQRDGIRVIQIGLLTFTRDSIITRLLSHLSFMVSLVVRGVFVQRPDVIFIENQPLFTALAGWGISKLKRAPYLANVSDFWPEYLVVAGIVSESSFVYRVFQMLTNLTQRQANGVVAMSPPLLEAIKQRLGDIQRGTVIYNAVDFDHLCKRIDETGFRKRYNLGSVRLITFLGILGRHIDLETMLEVAKLFRGVDDVKFVFVGAGVQKERLQLALQQADCAHCVWIDWLAYDDVPSFWSASYITYWALHDNPLDQMRVQAKLFEAMGTGTPMVVAVRGLMRDMITKADAGVAVMPYDVDGMRQALERLLMDEDYYKRLSTHARHYAEANFDPEQNADAYESMLRSIARVTESSQ